MTVVKDLSPRGSTPVIVSTVFVSLHVSNRNNGFLVLTLFTSPCKLNLKNQPWDQSNDSTSVLTQESEEGQSSPPSSPVTRSGGVT